MHFDDSSADGYTRAELFTVERFCHVIVSPGSQTLSNALLVGVAGDEHNVGVGRGKLVSHRAAKFWAGEIRQFPICEHDIRRALSKKLQCLRTLLCKDQLVRSLSQRVFQEFAGNR